MRDATTLCGATVTVGRSAAALCGATVQVQAVIDAGYVVPMNGQNIGLGVNAPDDTWSISAATVDTGTLTIDGLLLLYTPPTDYTGTAVVNYTLAQGGNTIDAQLDLTVIDTAPLQANADTHHVLQNSQLNIIAPLINDTGNRRISAASVDVGNVTTDGTLLYYSCPIGYTGDYNITYDIEPL
jgi:hypothetical protein